MNTARGALLIAMLFGGAALAKPQSKVEYPDQYKIDFSEFTYRTPVEPLKDDSQKVEVSLGASSWAPKPFTMDNRIRSHSAFESTLPSITAGIVTPALSNTRFGTIHGQISLGFNRLERLGRLSDGTAPSAQALYLLPLELGVRAKPLALHAGKLQGYVSAALGPALGFSERSVFDDGETIIGLIGAAQLGCEISLFGNTRLDLYGLTTLGSYNGQSLNALGAGAGLGVLL